MRPAVRLVPSDDFAFLLDGYRTLLAVPPETETHLYHVLRDALDAPGSLARAQLAYGLLKRPGVERTQARKAAIALEYFHTASLLFDDLPSMDDAKERRGRPCPHVRYGEAAAQLGALSFITRAYAMLWEVVSGLPARRRARATRLVEECLGVSGILNGQARDLHFGRGSRTPEDALSAARSKTVTLIRLTLLLPALIADAPARVLISLERAGESLGLAYQILDDFKDRVFSREESGKTVGRDADLGRPNFVLAAGREAALSRLRRLLRSGARAAAVVQRRGWGGGSLSKLHELLDQEAQSVAARLSACA